MEPYVAFSNDGVLQGAAPCVRPLEVQSRATIPVRTQPAPTEADCTEVPMVEAESTEICAEVMALQRFLLKNQLLQWPPPVGQQKSQIFPLLCMRRREWEKFSVVISLAAWRYYIPPSQ